MGVPKTSINNTGDTASPGAALQNTAEADGRGLRVIIAGGGTGGHLFPGIAIAEVLMKRQPESRIMFVTSGKKIEETVLAKTRFEKKLISVEGIKGRGLLAKLAAVSKLPNGLMDAIRLLREFYPDVVIGMGAYSAGPIIAAAWLLRMHRVICEQNSIPGLTNRLLAGMAEKIYVSFPDTRFKPSVSHKIEFTGNPVRDEIRSLAENQKKQDIPAEAGQKRFNILVLGGSQGAHSINMAVIDSVIYLKDTARFRFVHQTGARDTEEVTKVYRQMQVESLVAPFFDHMADLYQGADLVVCRSGATTVAELMVSGKAAVFIPFPFATDDHQVINARALVDGGAAEMILEKDLNGRVLAEKIDFYARHPGLITDMERKIRRFGRPDAADRIADDIFRIMRTGRRQNARAA